MTYDHVRQPGEITWIIFQDNKSSKTIFFSPTSPNEIARLILKLRNNCSAGIDGIKSQALKYVAHIVAPTLSHICNQMLTMGIFPDKLKIARVSVIHKGGEQNSFANYRPISVLSVFSKVAENVINTRLVSFLEKINAISNQQYGFQKGKSTEQALLRVKDEIINNIEGKRFMVRLFLDLKKAFDSVNHKVLLLKLPYYGIRGTPLDLIKSYLSSRVQCTSVNGVSSSYMDIRTGVPQGSILGPLLFLLHINDIVNIPCTPSMVMYADDTNIFFSGCDINSVASDANTWLAGLSKWLTANKIELNVQKTKFILFRPKNKIIDTEPIITFRNNALSRVDSIRFLGVIFNERLTWTDHVDRVCSKVSSSVGIIYKMRNLLPLWFKKQMYYALVQSYLHYCLLVWGSTTQSNLQSLFVLQKKKKPFVPSVISIIETVQTNTGANWVY